MTRREAVAALAAGGALLACGRTPREPRPVPIAIGRDECAWCRMPIDDARLAAESVPRDGAPALFGEVGCLLSWRVANRAAAGVAFVAAAESGAWLYARRAAYVVGATMTPMLFNITAYGAVPAGVSAGGVVTWESLVEQGVPRATPG